MREREIEKMCAEEDVCVSMSKRSGSNEHWGRDGGGNVSLYRCMYCVCACMFVCIGQLKATVELTVRYRG